MTHARPIPEASQSPYPIQEPPHAPAAPESVEPSPSAAANDPVGEAVAKASDTIAPLADKAKAFAKARPYATAALVGTIALAVFNTLRGKRVGR